MNDIATIHFTDAYSADKSAAVVRSAPGVVGLALSQNSNGDVEVFLSESSARELLLALQQALAKVGNVA
jgi:hypothetical protein